MYIEIYVVSFGDDNMAPEIGLGMQLLNDMVLLYECIIICGRSQIVMP